MLVLGADNHVPLRVATSHLRRHVHLRGVVVDAQFAIRARKSHAGVERAACAEPIVVREPHGTVLLARPRVVHVPQRLPFRHVGHLVLIAVYQSREPQGEGAGTPGRHVQLETQVLIVQRLLLHIDGMQFLGYLQETVAVVHQIRRLRALCQRALGGEINAQCAHLDGMLVLRVITHAHLHVEST